MNKQAEDFNAFNAWDSFGATFMLGMVPAIMNYVFSEPHEVASTVFIVIIAVLISLAVLALALITRWRIIGTLVNFFGGILTVIYAGTAAYFWWFTDDAPGHQPTEDNQQITAPQPK